MHLLTRSYFDSFIADFNLAFSESKNFEAFAAYCVFRRYSADNVDPRDLVYEGADPGIDSAFLFLDDRAIFSATELQEIIEGSKKEYEATVVIIQAKTSSTYNKQEIDSFVVSAVDLLSDAPQQPHAPHLGEFRDTFLALFKNIGRIKYGKPSLYAAFVNTAADTDAAEILAAYRAGKRNFDNVGYFQNVVFDRIWREPLHQLWLNVGGSVEAMLPVVGNAPFPKVASTSDAYVATVKAKDFIERVLKGPDGAVRSG